MEFEYSNKWNGISKVNINAGDTWEYLGITNKYLNSVFSKIDDGKKDENGYREVSQQELSVLEKLFKIISEKTGYNRFFDKDFQEMEKIIDDGQIDGLPQRSSDEVKDDEPQYKENVTHHYYLTKQDLDDIENGKTDLETIRQKYIDKIKEDLKQYNNYDERFPEGRYEVEVIYNGKYFESFVYDKEFESFKKSDPKKLQRAVDEFENGNFDAINTIENPVEFMEAYRKKNGGKTMFSALISSYQEGILSSDKLKEYMDTLQARFTEYEQEYKKVNADSNFDTAYSFWDAGTFYKLSSRVNNYIESTEHMQYKYEHYGLDKEQVKDLQKFVKENYNIELNEYVAARIIEQGSTQYDYRTYDYDFEDIKKRFTNLNQSQVEYYTQFGRRDAEHYEKDDVSRKEINELQQLFKESYNVDISESQAAFLIKLERIGLHKGFNLEKLKEHLLSGQFFKDENFKDFQDFLDKRIIWEGVVDNDNLEILEDLAQATEQEYGRYKFDISKSAIADLARQSEMMRAKAEKELDVTKIDTKIIIKNNSTGEVRVIDLEYLTTELDDKHKQIFLESINGFNKLSLWEFAIEAANKIGTAVHDEKRTLAEYSVDNDNININPTSEEQISSYSLLHETMHAMMATIIDGKNTLNENLFKELVDTFEEEQNVYREKRFRNGSVDGSNYTYCAQNLTEFAAEAGCLWMSGHSNSEFTIATHFPKSYRLFIQLIEKIRAQKTSRSTNEQA